VDPQSGFPVPMHHEVSGYAVAIPMGGSLLGRFPLGRFAINVELGARFVPIVSEVEYAVSMPNPLNPQEQTTLEQTVTIRPPIIAIAAADLEYQLDSGISLFAGGGYQYDLLQPEIEIDTMGNGSRTESNEMKAWFVRAGIIYRF
jgi:opacity protein-like surface antigen